MGQRSLNSITLAAKLITSKKNDTLNTTLFNQLVTSRKDNGFSDYNNSVDIENIIAQRTHKAPSQDKQR